MPPIGDEDEVIENESHDQDLDEETVEEEDEDLESEEEELDESSEEEEAESEDEEEEQSEEDQDLELDEEEEDEELGEESGFKFKDKKSGNFDWDRINKRLGGSDLQKTFLESQKTITRVSQEKKGLEEKIGEYEAEVPQLQQQAHLFRQFDHLIQTDPDVQRAVVAALQRQGGGNPGPGQLPEGVNPNDPLVPILMETQRALSAIQNQQRMEQSTREQNQVREMERQGLTQARDRFQQLTGRLPTKEELGRVLQEMRKNRMPNGALLVPGLFVEEIQKSERRKLDKSREKKRNLPKTVKKSVRGKVGTPKKGLSLQEAAEKAIAELGIDF